MNPRPAIVHVTDRLESCRPPTNDERVAAWAVKYFTAGHHHRISKPRIRVPDSHPADLPGDPPLRSP
jgi:hypothetical protein